MELVRGQLETEVPRRGLEGAQSIERGEKVGHVGTL
jgi:hypothetical protein